MTVQDVITTIDHAFDIRCTHLVGILGERHPKQMIIPDAVIALDVEGAADDLDILDFIRTNVDDFGISFHAGFGVLRDFCETLHRTFLTEVINAMGWMLVTEFRNIVDANITSLQLVKRPGALAIARDDLIYCIAIHLFLTKIKTWNFLGEQPEVRCKVKLWHVWVWDSLIDPSMFRQAEAIYSDNYQDLAHMESSNFESALAVALRMIVKNDQPIPRYDITRFLSLETKFHDGFLKICGDFSTLREFLSLMKDIGMEAVWKKFGLIAMCAIISFSDPLEAEIVFVKIPDKRAVTTQFVEAILRSVLVTLGMPSSTDNSDDVVLKMKLWGVVIYNARLPRMFPMQEIMDVWDQACTIVGSHFDVRLVSHAGVVNPDFALKHYSRCGENDVSTAVMTFVGALKGGGPSEKAAAHVHDFNIQQKNGLATFLLSQGADLKESLVFIDSILKGAGGSAVSNIMGQKRFAKKWEGLTQLAMALNIQMPQIAQKLQKTKNKIQKKFQDFSKSLPANIPVESLCLKEGFLKNQDDSNCQQLPRMAPNVSGVVLMKFEDTSEWIEKTVVLSQDELAVVIIGKCRHDDPSKCCKIQLPVCLKDEPLILQACLHQLGAKHVKVENTDEHEIPLNETQVMSVTAVRQEIPDEAWENLLQSPVKSMLSLLGSDIADIVFVSPIPGWIKKSGS
eukprot:s3008_g6.t1